MTPMDEHWEPCQLVRTAGDTEIECLEDAHPYRMADGGTVWLCLRHRSWGPALAPVQHLDGSQTDG